MLKHSPNLGNVILRAIPALRTVAIAIAKEVKGVDREVGPEADEGAAHLEGGGSGVDTVNQQDGATGPGAVQGQLMPMPVEVAWGNGEEWERLFHVSKPWPRQFVAVPIRAQLVRLDA